LQQAVDIVKKYINENPAQLHKSADTIVTMAIAKDFPCKKK
jgi:alanine-alpha-ketoisovalerate/valine-pyruvate aminotransferase